MASSLEITPIFAHINQAVHRVPEHTLKSRGWLYYARFPQERKETPLRILFVMAMVEDNMVSVVR
jgi:hypothetical protein